MIRTRFYVNKKKCGGDYRPLKWPIKHPYWCTGESNNDFVLVAYANSIEEIKELWPESSSIDVQEVEKVVFTDRFKKPDWY